MKKILLVLMAATMLLGLFAACDGADEFDERLIGQWAYMANVAWTYTFNADGTGVRGQGRDLNEFTWSTRNDNSLRINPGRGYQNETWDYRISNGTIRLEGAAGGHAGAIFEYYLMGHNPALVDTWISPEFGMTITFNANGSAQITDFFGDVESAEWFSTTNRLVFDVGTINQEEWDMTITADGLFLVNRHIAGLEVNMIREADFVPQEVEIIGTWEWDEDYAYIYVFYEDGTGHRGFGDDREHFRWVTMMGSLILNEGVEVWEYSITNDVLTLNMQGILIYNYIRVTG